MTDNYVITSPVGQIQFMALNRKVKNKPTDEEPSVYTIRLAFDGNTAEGAEFRDTISEVNAGLIGTKHAPAEGWYTVKASTKFDVEVLGPDGETMEEVPYFTKGSTGTAAISVKPYTGNSLGGSINLTGVAILELDIAESESSGNTVSEQTVNSLRDAINKHNA